MSRWAREIPTSSQPPGSEPGPAPAPPSSSGRGRSLSRSCGARVGSPAPGRRRPLPGRDRPSPCWTRFPPAGGPSGSGPGRAIWSPERGPELAAGLPWTGWRSQGRGASEMFAQYMDVEERSGDLILYPEDTQDVKKPVLFGPSQRATANEGRSEQGEVRPGPG